QAIIFAHHDQWIAPLKALGVQKVGFRRGFVEEIRIEADKAAENSAAIRARAPVRELVIHDWWMQQGPVARTAKALFASDLMPALTDLTLSRIDSPVLKELANCKRLTHLGGLTLSGSASDVSWLEPAPLLSRLSRLTLDGINRNSTESL